MRALFAWLWGLVGWVWRKLKAGVVLVVSWGARSLAKVRAFFEAVLRTLWRWLVWLGQKIRALWQWFCDLFN